MSRTARRCGPVPTRTLPKSSSAGRRSHSRARSLPMASQRSSPGSGWPSPGPRAAAAATRRTWRRTWPQVAQVVAAQPVQLALAVAAAAAHAGRAACRPCRAPSAPPPTHRSAPEPAPDDHRDHAERHRQHRQVGQHLLERVAGHFRDLRRWLKDDLASGHLRPLAALSAPDDDRAHRLPSCSPRHESPPRASRSASSRKRSIPDGAILLILNRSAGSPAGFRKMSPGIVGVLRGARRRDVARRRRRPNAATTSRSPGAETVPPWALRTRWPPEAGEAPRAERPRGRQANERSGYLPGDRGRAAPAGGPRAPCSHPVRRTVPCGRRLRRAGRRCRPSGTGRLGAAATRPGAVPAGSHPAAGGPARRRADLPAAARGATARACVRRRGRRHRVRHRRPARPVGARGNPPHRARRRGPGTHRRGGRAVAFRATVGRCRGGRGRSHGAAAGRGGGPFAGGRGRRCGHGARLPGAALRVPRWHARGGRPGIPGPLRCAGTAVRVRRGAARRGPGRGGGGRRRGAVPRCRGRGAARYRRGRGWTTGSAASGSPGPRP